jgi:hypothetical protein
MVRYELQDEKIVIDGEELTVLLRRQAGRAAQEAAASRPKPSTNPQYVDRPRLWAF